eukprot:SAG31_NODE_1478_length_8183_cov_5.227992_6_plen_67_part_00
MQIIARTRAAAETWSICLVVSSWWRWTSGQPFVPGELRHSDSDQQRTPPLSLLYTVVLSYFLFKFM